MEIIEVKLGQPIASTKQMAACIGYFDGFHVGHQGLFQATLAAAKKQNLHSAIITFDPDPWVVLKGIDQMTHISSLQDRARWALELGFDYFVLVEFTKELATLSPTVFADQILIPLSIRHLICGFDFRFGAKGEGSVQWLKEYAKATFKVQEVPEITYEGLKISSTRVTNEIEAGNMSLVTTLLSRPYQVEGYVIPGRQQGRNIGFPTANVKLKDFYIIPKRGVYIGEVVYDQQQYQAMINIGYNPTFNTSDTISIEVHILDFHKMIYGELLQVRFLSYLRPEAKFASVDELITRMQIDEHETRVYFEEAK